MKRHRVVGYLKKKKKDPPVYFSQETHFTSKDIKPQSEWMEQDIPCRCKPKKSGISHTYTRQYRFQQKKVTENEGHYRMINRLITQEDKQS